MPNIRHAFVSTKTDSLDATLVRPSNWNAPLQYEDTSGDPSGISALVREVLTTHRTYYVRPNGNDNNNGLTDTSSGAFLTINRAITAIWYDIDLNGYRVIIQLADGTYNEDVYINGVPAGLVGHTPNVLLNGNATTPANVVLNGSSFGLLAESGGDIGLSNFEIRSGGVGVYSFGSRVGIGAGMRFGTCTGAHIQADVNGIVGFTTGAPTTVVGGASAHMMTRFGGVIEHEGANIIVSGTPAFTQAFAIAEASGMIHMTGATITGAATGKRFKVDTGGGIHLITTDYNFFPGDEAGDIRVPGYYGAFGQGGPFIPTPYNAIGDGVTDDSTALQSWLDSGLPELYLPDAVFATTVALTVPSTVRRIDGPGTLLWTGANGSGFVFDLSATYANGLLIENITISKPWTGTPANGGCIFFNSDNIVIRNVACPHGGSYALYFQDGASNIVVEECTIEDAYRNLLAAYNNAGNIEVTIRKCHLKHNHSAIHQAIQLGAGPAEGNAILIEDCSCEMIGAFTGTPGGFFISSLSPGSGIIRCRFMNMGADAIEVGGDSRGFRICDNIFYSTVGSDVGFGVSPEVGFTCINGLVSGNLIIGNGGQGLAIGFTGTTQDIVVCNNTIINPCQDFASDGITAINCTNCDFHDNDIRDDGTGAGMNYGIKEFTSTSSSGNRFNNNQIRGATIADYNIVSTTSVVTGIPEIIKTANESISSDNALSDDNTLKFKVTSGCGYKFKFKVWYHTLAIADFKYTVTGPGGSSVIMQTRAVAPDVTETLTQEVAFNFGPNAILSAAGTEGYLEIDGISSVGADGSITFQWSQNSSDVSTTTVYKASSVTYEVTT